MVAMAMSLLLLVQTTPTTALVPYGRGLRWDDLLDDPFHVLEHSPFSSPSPTPRISGAGGIALARCDWKEMPEAHIISVDVPGVRREDVKVEVEENSRVLRVSGERRTEVEEKDGERWHRAERAAGRFWRRFRMPAGVDVERVMARLENGVLTVTVPKVVGHRGREPRVVSIVGGGEEGGVETKEVKASKAEM